jgi:hypothetical protein
MSDYKRQQTDYECPPRPKNPAPQPKDPKAKPCGDQPKPSEPPKLNDPDPCPKSDCDCPPGIGPDPTCLDDLIAQQTTQITAAAKAQAFKAELEGLLAKAKAAKQDYTRVKYESLRKRWVDEDIAVAELIRKLVCALGCWKCVIECYICPLLNQIRDAEKRLYLDGVQYADVKTLYQLQFWLARDKEAKDRRFTRIKTILAAWEKPATTIDKVLTDNAALIDASSKLLGTDPGKAVYDIFFKLVPMHLAIAPPATSPDWTTRISADYTVFCVCDKDPDPEDCCGPNVGDLGVRQRLTPPQPYLIDPADYMDMICCLVKTFYAPAKEALAKAESDSVNNDNDIKRYLAVIDNGFKNIEKDAKGAIPPNVDCCDFEKPDGNGQGQAGAAAR